MGKIFLSISDEIIVDFSSIPALLITVTVGILKMSLVVFS